MNDKKGIGPVVATALLIVVAVVTVVGFQNWFGLYSSGIYVKTEQESQSSTVNSIETIVGNQLYIKGGVNTSIKQILIDGKECSFTGNISGVQNISIADCIDNLSTNSPEVVIILDDKVLSKKIYLKDAQISTSIVSSLDIGSECRFKDNKTGCEHYYVETVIDGIPAIEDTILGLYWQKNMSSYLDYDGTTLNWTDARNYCSGLGDGNWRLPTLVELEVSLIDTSSKLWLKIVDVGFTNFEEWYWLNTIHSSSFAFIIHMMGGDSNYYSFNGRCSVVCVKTAS